MDKEGSSSRYGFGAERFSLLAPLVGRSAGGLMLQNSWINLGQCSPLFGVQLESRRETHALLTLIFCSDVIRQGANLMF